MNGIETEMLSAPCLTAVYAPTGVCKLAVKEMLYAKLAPVMDICPRRDICFVLGDINAVSGCSRASYEISVSLHGSGAVPAVRIAFFSRSLQGPRS